MHRAVFRFWILVFLLLPSAASGHQFERAQGNIIFGDLKVTVKESGMKAPLSYLVILYSAQGNVVDRQPVSANGRYRFMNVPNGEYDIAVEAENRELTRINFLLTEGRVTDLRKDISVVWTGDAPPAPSAPAGTLAAYPRSAQNAALMEQALAASGRKDYAGAVTLLKQIVGADSKDFIAWTEMGTAQFMQGDKGEAEKSYKRALEEKPAYAVALLNLGRLQFAQKNYDTAIETLSRFVAAEAASAEGHRLLGEAYLQSKKGSKAVPELEKAIALDPSGQAEAHLRLASLYNAAGYKNLAAAEYEKFLSKRPDYPDRKKLEDYIRQNKP